MLHLYATGDDVSGVAVVGRSGGVDVAAGVRSALASGVVIFAAP